MGPSKPRPETRSRIPQTVKQGRAVMFDLRSVLRLLGMGARLRVGTGQMKGEAVPCGDGVDTPWQQNPQERMETRDIGDTE